MNGPEAAGRRLRAQGFLALLAVMLCPRLASAHPVPFSYVDLRLEPAGMSGTIVVHVFDVAHDLGVTPMERLLDPTVASARSADIVRLLRPRFAVFADGRLLDGRWSAAEPLADRQLMRFRVAYDVGGSAGRISVRAEAFPYDPEHRTFLNVYEAGALAMQEILDRGRQQVDYYSGTRQGLQAVMARFLPSGVHHIMIGPDHVLFLAGLLLSGGRVRRLLLIVTAFTLAHSITLSLAALEILTLPAWIVEPAIALSIVYVGLDNLMRGDGRDMRAWIAFVFGFIHGFGFANVLADMALPPRALGWSLFSFNLGVEVGQVFIVTVLTTAFFLLRKRWAGIGQPLMVAGSCLVILAGAYWFVERTFLAGA